MTTAVVVVAMSMATLSGAQAMPTVVAIAPQINPLSGIAARGDISGVACVSAHSCVAVGSDVSEPIVLIGDPTTWNAHDVRQITLGNAFSSTGLFDSVSCITETDCVAVGYDSSDTIFDSQEPIVAFGNPATWTSANVRQIALGARFGDGGELTSVSCVSPSYCVAVGLDDGGDGDESAIVISGNPGSWKQSAVHQLWSTEPNWGPGSELLGVTCTAVSMCVAVGDANDEPLLFSGNPTTWSSHRARIVIDHDPSYSGGSLTAVTCLSTDQCVAVGDEYVGSSEGDQPLAVSGDPATWTARDYRVMVLGPHFGDVGQLSAISCTSFGWCDAVGWSNGSTAQPIDVAGNPSTWDTSRVRQLPVPRSFGSGGSLNAVTCSALTCEAIGTDGEWSNQILQVSGEPSQWKVLQRDVIHLSGSAFGANADIASMTCVTNTECVGVGIDSNGDGIVMLGDPAHWVNATTVALTQSAGLTAVSCTSSVNCVAVGSSTGSYPIVFTGDPRAWTNRSGKVLAVNPLFGFGGQLSGVSCASTTFCVAVGTDNNVITHSGEGQPIELTGNPTTWSGSRIRQFAMSEDRGYGGALDAVDCTSRRWCVAVGGDQAGQILVQQGDPANWTASAIAQVTVPGSLSSYGLLNSVTCFSTTSCVAVGLTGRPLVMVGNPRTWGSAEMTGVYVVPPLHDTVHAYYYAPQVTYSGDLGLLPVAFESVSCLSRVTCAVAGVDESGAPIVLGGSVASWRLAPAVRISSPAFDSANLDTTVCTATACYIVGSSPEGPFVAPV